MSNRENWVNYFLEILKVELVTKKGSKTGSLIEIKKNNKVYKKNTLKELP